jgi:hypothetical protein
MAAGDGRGEAQVWCEAVMRVLEIAGCRLQRAVVQCSDRQSMGGGRECEAGRLQFWCEWDAVECRGLVWSWNAAAGAPRGYPCSPSCFFGVAHHRNFYIGN